MGQCSWEGEGEGWACGVTGTHVRTCGQGPVRHGRPKAYRGGKPRQFPRILGEHIEKAYRGELDGGNPDPDTGISHSRLESAMQENLPPDNISYQSKRLRSLFKVPPLNMAPDACAGGCSSSHPSLTTAEWDYGVAQGSRGDTRTRAVLALSDRGATWEMELGLLRRLDGQSCAGGRG